MRRTNSSSAPFFSFIIFGKTVPGPLCRAMPSITTFKTFLGSTGERTLFGVAFAMISAGVAGGVTEGITGESKVGVMISGIAIFGAEFGSGFGIDFVPDIAGAGYIAGSIVGLCGINGFGASGILTGRAGTFCSVGGGKDAMTSPGVSENFTKMGLDTRWSIELTDALMR